MPFRVIVNNDSNKEVVILGGWNVVYVADSYNLKDKDGGLKKLTPTRMVTKEEYENLVTESKIDPETLYLITTP